MCLPHKGFIMRQTRSVLKTLKARLRSHGISDIRVAIHLGLSEASVERLDSQCGRSLERLEQVCRAKSERMLNAFGISADIDQGFVQTGKAELVSLL